MLNIQDVTLGVGFTWRRAWFNGGLWCI